MNVDLVKLSVCLRVVVFSYVHLDRSREIPIRVDVTENALVSASISFSTIFPCKTAFNFKNNNREITPRSFNVSGLWAAWPL